MANKSYWRVFGVAVAAAALVALVTVPLALANTATPTTSHATWSYVGGSSGPVDVTVTGDWNWPTQSCAQGGPKGGGGVSATDVNGHYAIGFAGSWNDSTTPNTLTGKDVNGNPVTLHVGNTMDQSIVNYCEGTTAASPYPSGTYEITHQYPSYAAFQSSLTNGQVCVNAYDIHQQNNANDWNPGKNGDNTLQAHQFVLGSMCMTATPAAPPVPQPALQIQKVESVWGAGGTYVPGPVSAKVGDTVFYEMVVTNTGNTTLSETLSDPRCDAGTLSQTAPVTLVPGQSATYYCSHLLTSKDVPRFVNVATARGQSVDVQANAVSVNSAPAVVRVSAAGVKGAHKTLKRVTHKAKPAKPVVRAASYTG